MSEEQPVIWLDPEDKELIYDLAHKRDRKKEKFGHMTHRETKTSLEAHIEGMHGEVAVAKHYRVEPDRLINDDGGGPDFDNTINGYTVEVKTRPPYADNNLMVVVKNFKNADVYICCSWAEGKNYVRLLGWEWGDRVKQVEPRCWEPGLPKSYIIPVIELHNFRELFDREAG